MATLLDAYAPYDSGPGANVTETVWRQFMSRVAPTGVFAHVANEFRAFGDSTGMQIKVDTGECWIQGAWGQSNAIKILPVTAAPTTVGYTRIDMIVLRNDFTANTIAADVVTGVAGATPSAPTPTQNTAIWEITLGYISVGNSVATITATNVTDWRTWCYPRARYNSTATAPTFGTSYAPMTFPTPVRVCSDVVASGTNNTTFTLGRSGVWSIGCWIHATTSSANTYINIAINGTQLDWGDTFPGNAGGENFRSVRTDYEAAAGDTVQVTFSSSASWTPSPGPGGLTAAINFQWMHA